MISNVGESAFGNVMVQTTSNRGFTPEELAERAVSKILSISDQADPMVQAQAHAFKARVYEVILFYMKQAVESNNTTLVNRFNAAGHPELIALLKEH